MKKGNFRMKCVDTDGDTRLTLGKIYEVKNGYSKWNDGEKMPQNYRNGISKFDSFEDVHKWMKCGMSLPKFELIEEEPEIHITTKGTTVYGVMKKYGEVVKRADAKLYPSDVFKFETGADLVLGRLFDKKNTHRLGYLRSDGHNYGTMGEPTNITALFGQELFVGDMVEMYDTDTNKRHIAFVIDSDGYTGIMGVHCASRGMKNGIVDKWQVIKIKSYEDLVHGERDDYGVVACLEEE